MDRSAWLKERFPEQYEQLRSYPGASNDTTDGFLYWSRESYGFGLKPILNLFHVGIRKVNSRVILISSKQIRSTHYFDGSLGLSVLFDADAPGKQCYMIYINRSRIDLLRGWGWKRALFERRLPVEIRKQLVLIQKNVEESKGGRTANPTLPSS